MNPDRIAFFEDYLKKKPGDDFAQYALAMEYARVERYDDAFATYEALLTRNLVYSAGHFQYALLLRKQGRTEDAKARLQLGITAATRTNDAHARREMQGVLDELEADDS